MTSTSKSSRSVSERSHVKPQNLYRERWALPLQSPPKLGAQEDSLRMRCDLLAVRQRFSTGMVYEVRGKRFLLKEEVFNGYPFLLNFLLVPTQRVDFTAAEYNGLPDAVSKEIRLACEEVTRTIQLPPDLHNVEAEVTEAVSRKIKLPAGWTLTKAIMKVTIGPNGLQSVACNCDVDGPCGYCCDTCDCQSCYLCC